MLVATALIIASPPPGALAQDLAPAGSPSLDEKAAAPSFDCRTFDGTPLCVYRGPVRLTYVNDRHLILLYPDSTVAPTTLVQSEVEAEGYESFWGIDVTVFNAFAVEIPSAGSESSDPNRYKGKQEFADKAYAMLLAAKLGDRFVTAQMYGGYAGWLRIDRVWIE